MDSYDENGRNGKNRAASDPPRRALLVVALCLLLVACNLASPASTRTVAQASAQATPLSDPQTTDLARLAIVTATPNPSLALNAPVPYSYTEALEQGPLLLDPILAWDQASQTVVRNVMETLVYPHPHEGDSYVPLLATGWRISNEGRTYTFSIRRGVRFSNGNPLTASDVAYSLQRLLLVSPPGGPQHLLLEPLLGYEVPNVITATTPITATVDGPTDVLAAGAAAPSDIVSAIGHDLYSGDRAALRANVPAHTLLAACQQLQAAIVANDGDGAVTIHLDRPWAPFLSVMSQTWTSVVDRQWAVERGAWDGRCETWQNWYALRDDESALATAILGTGPYTLDYWAPAAYVLLANESYWRGDSPMWPGGPSGAPALHSVRVLQIPDDNDRWQLLESGAAQVAVLSRAGALLAERQTGLACDWPDAACLETTTPGAPLRRVDNIPLGLRQALFFNANIPLEQNAYLGSGQLDGEGIPPDFFADEHVRRAFAYCLDHRGFVEAGLGGAGSLVQGLLPPYISSLPRHPTIFPYRLQLCSEELAQAWDGRLPDAGFRLQLPFESGDAAQQAAAVLLQNSLRALNPAYRVEPIGLPPSLMQQAVRERRAPLALFSWTPALPDAYYWIAPAFGRGVAAFQQLPPDVVAEAHDLLAELRDAAGLSSRAPAYAALNVFYQRRAPFVLLPEPATTLYQRRDLQQWLFNAADPLPYYYAYR